MPRRVSSSAALRADHPRWLFKDAANPLSALNRLLFPHLRWRHGLGRRQRVLSAPTDQLSLLLVQGRIGRPCRIGLAKSGYRTFDALRFWSLWPPRFASVRKSRWGSMVTRGGKSKSRILFADDSPARTHPRLEGQAKRLRAFRGLYCQRAQPAVFDVTKCLLADISAPAIRGTVRFL